MLRANWTEWSLIGLLVMGRLKSASLLTKDLSVIGIHPPHLHVTFVAIFYISPPLGLVKDFLIGLLISCVVVVGIQRDNQAKTDPI